MKDWTVGNEDCVSFHTHDKILTKGCVQFHEVCWKRRRSRLSAPEVQMKVLKQGAISLLEDARKDEVKGLKRHVEVSRIEASEATSDELLSWIKSMGIF